jgi:hypothetical protein
MRIRVPERDELLAMALATLAVGLVLGLAIGPGLGNAGRVLPLISPPLAQLPALPDEADDSDATASLPALSAPAGSEIPVAGPTPPAAAPVTVIAAAPVAGEAPTGPVPDNPAPAPAPAALAPEPREPSAPAPQGLQVTGTVLASSVNGKSFALADRSGNLQTVFSDFPPEPGERISTTVLPLVNGTFSEYGGRRSIGTRQRASVRGMISYIDRELDVIVLSNRGTSLPLDGSAVSGELLPADPVDPDASPPLADGDWVEVDLRLAEDPPVMAASEIPARPGSSRAAVASSAVEDATMPAADPALGLQIEALERLDETATSIELTGRLLELDRKTGRLLMSADSVGLLDRTIEISTPGGFDSTGVTTGRVYSATVRRTATGELRLTGFSPGYSVRAADDPTEVFGEQGF